MRYLFNLFNINRSLEIYFKKILKIDYKKKRYKFPHKYLYMYYSKFLILQKKIKSSSGKKLKNRINLATIIILIISFQGGEEETNNRKNRIVRALSESDNEIRCYNRFIGEMFSKLNPDRNRFSYHQPFWFTCNCRDIFSFVSRYVW